MDEGRWPLARKEQSHAIGCSRLPRHARPGGRGAPVRGRPDRQPPEEAEALYSRLGIQRECWHLQDTSNGPWVIVVTDMSGEPVAAGEIYAASQAGFERWFKDQVKLVTGIDQDNQPLGPPTEMLLDLTLPQTGASREG